MEGCRNFGTLTAYMIRKALKFILLTFIGLLVLEASFSYSQKKSLAKTQISSSPIITPVIQIDDSNFIIKLKEGSDQSELPSNTSITILKENREKNLVNIKINNNADIVKIKNDSDVDYIEKDYKRSLLVTPSDTYFNSQNNIINGQYDQWDIRKISLLPTTNLSSGWNVSKGSSTTIIAVIDTGVDLTHPDLAGNLLVNSGETAGDGIDNDADGCIDNTIGRNFAVETGHNCADTQDINSHGTHVSGIIGAVSHNTTGIAGICWFCKIMPLKVIYANGFGYDSDISTAIRYAVDYKIAHEVSNTKMIINMSLGGAGFSQTLQDAINYAWNNDVLVVSAAGNFIQASDSYPGGAQHSLSIGSTNYADSISGFSYSDPRIDLTAPGENILSTTPQSFNTGCGGITGSYRCLSGTSMASPHVAGVAALLIDLHYNDATPWTAKDVRAALLKNTDDFGSLGYDNSFGYGRLNAKKVLDATNPNLSSDIIDPLSVLNVPAATVIKGNLQINGTASDDNLYLYTISITDASFGSGVVKQVSGRNNVTSNSLYTIDSTSFSDGNYDIDLAVEDLSGKVTNSNTVRVTIDNNSPSSFSTMAPASSQWVNTLRPTFTWGAPSDISALSYNLVIDGVTVGANLSGNSFTLTNSLTEGSHTWYVQAKDSVNQTSTSNTANFSIDTTPPNAFSVNVSIQGPTPTFTFSTSDNINGSGMANYDISVDGGSYFTTSSPYLNGPLGDGGHTITVRAKDNVQNTTLSTATFSINYRASYLITKADFNIDGKVDLSDLSILAQYWQKNTSQGDANGDGKVDLSDLGVLAQNWQKSF